MAQHLPNSFIAKEFKRSREEILFKREQSFFPDTMIFIERSQQIKALEKEYGDLSIKRSFISQQKKALFAEDKDLKKKQSIIRQQMQALALWECASWELILKSSKPCPDCIQKSTLALQKEDDDLKTKRFIISQQIKALKEEDGTLMNKRMIIFQQIQTLSSSMTANSATDDKKNIRSCSSFSCKGFINSKGECPICQKKTCLQCNVIAMNHDHECRKEDLETWELIQQSSKPCPNCSTRIQKSFGCSQMWCPGCHKAFNWNTGKMENGPVHNPHFHEYAARLGLHNPENFHCQNVWDSGAYPPTLFNDKTFRKVFHLLWRLVHHELPRTERNAQRDNTDLRINFLLNKIDEKVFKKTLLRREIKMQINDRVLALYQSIQASAIFHLDAILKHKTSLGEFMNSMVYLDEFIRTSLYEIDTIFHSKTYQYKCIELRKALKHGGYIYP